jgi:hypothetical protein
MVIKVEINNVKYEFVTPVTSMIVVDNQAPSTSSNLERDAPIKGQPPTAKVTIHKHGV